MVPTSGMRPRDLRPYRCPCRRSNLDTSGRGLKMAEIDQREDTSEPGLIIVGVDGSEPSKAALQWALNRHDGAAVEAIYVYEPPPAATWIVGSQPIVVPTPDIYHDVALEALQKTVAEVTAGQRVEVAEIVAAGSPSQILCHYAARASLLVVGAHVARGFGRLLGSTAVSCMRHARCPVVVVPLDWAAPKTSGGEVADAGDRRSPSAGHGDAPRVGPP